MRSGRIHEDNIISLLHGITSICPTPEQSSKSKKIDLRMRTPPF